MVKRGMIMEIKGSKAVVLTERGEFLRIRLNKKRGLPDVGDRMIVPAVHDKAGHFKHWLSAIIKLNSFSTKDYKQTKNTEKTG